jgi:uncharacterized membrane protein YedE/YeeE
MKHLSLVFLSGLLFALGLGVGGMTDANKVIGFLNLAGDWDPSLAFVMVGAIGVHLALFKLITKRSSPLFGDVFHVPAGEAIDKRLVAGAALFGVGWGLGGFCPGPGIVSSVGLGSEVLVFTASMLLGMLVFERTAKPKAAAGQEGKRAAACSL